MLNFDPAILAPYFQYFDAQLGPFVNAQNLIAKANPSRVTLIFSAINQSVQVRPLTFNSVNLGWTVPANGAPLILKFADLGGIVGLPWYCGTVTSQQLYVGEVVFYPPKVGA